MISIIITAFKEPKTIGKAIIEIATQELPKHEIIVTAPDDETINEGKKLKKRFKNLRFIKDAGNGKPAALNLVVPQTKGTILILTDGDIHIGKNSIPLMLNHFKDKKVGAVTGNPISLDSKKNKYGFWAYLLTNIANERRKRASKLKKRFFCSGYLFAIKKSLFPKLQEDILSEDGFISHNVYANRHKIAYSPESKAFIKYPNNFEDWIKQKRRSAGGYNQIKNLIDIEIRSFKKESLGGLEFFKYLSNVKESFWLFQLFVSRIYLWFIIRRDIDIRKKSHKDIWLRVESTK